MVVVADTSPLNYLILIGEIEILPKLYKRVTIPRAVMDELKHPAAPALVGKFAAPGWLEVVESTCRISMHPPSQWLTLIPGK